MISFLVTPPALVYKFNHKGELVKNFDSLNQSGKDSALWYSSRYIQYISDSIILENFINGFLDESRSLGFKMLLNSSADSFNYTGAQSYLLDIAQFQLDEYLYTVEDEGEFYDSIYTKKIDLNTVDFSAWFDIRKSGIKNPAKTTLYATSPVYSEFEGHFFTDPFSGKIRYKYSIQDLELEDLYKMAGTLGKKYAGYLYDFFLNQYIARNLPPGETMSDYFHFSRKYNTIIPAYEERFEVLPNK